MLTRLQPGLVSNIHFYVSICCFPFVFQNEKAISVALDKVNTSSESVILKPQRDGGGNNYYGPQILEKVSSLTHDQMSAYTLMEKILPPKRENYLISVGNPSADKLCEVVSELGMFGAIIV